MPELRNRKHRLRPFMVGNNPVQSRKPHEPSAAIHIEDDNAGFLTARLTTAQRDAIPEPTVAVFIWNVDTAQFEYYDGTAWVPFGGIAAPTSVNIPIPQITVDQGEDVAARDIRLFFTQSANHLAALNPKFIMMRYKQARTASSASRGRKASKRWVHPTHQNGALATPGTNIGGGQHTRADGSLVPPRDTEWVPASLDPFNDTAAAVDFTEWFTIQTTALSGKSAFLMSGDAKPYGNEISSRSQIFAFAVEIDNPDPLTAVKSPRVRSAVSESVAVRWDANTNKLMIALGGQLPTARRWVP